MPPKAAKRGLSLEEKRSKLLQFFTKDHLFYNIKEVESLGGKFTGVHPMQIKEILQSLVDDGLVKAEKCGITILYWCFEYDQQKKFKDMIEKEEIKLDKLSSESKSLQKKIKAEQKARKNGDSELKMVEIEELRKERKSLQDQFESSGFNTERVNEVKALLQQEIEIGEACTDNIESMLYFFKSRNGVDRKVFEQELGIPEEFSDFPNLNELFENLS